MKKKYEIPRICVEELFKSDVLLESSKKDIENGEKNGESLLGFTWNQLTGG